jgi:AsmA protein
VNQFRPTIEQKASAALGRQVNVGNMSLSLISGSLAADNLSIADDAKFNKGTFLAAKSIKVGVQLLPLIFSKELNITDVTIDNPEVTLLRNAAGEWSYSSFGTSGGRPSAKARQAARAQPESASPVTSEEFSVEKLALRNGRINVGSTTSARRSVYDKVDLNASNVSLTRKFPVTLSAALPGGGELKLDGQVGPLDESDSTLTPLEAKLTVSALNLATTGFLDPSAGLGGLLDLNTSLASQNGEARINGTGKVSRALLVQGGSPAGVPVNVDFRSKYDLRKNTGVLEPSQLKIGGAVAHLGGTYEIPTEGAVVHLKIEAQNMPAKDLEAFLPAVGVNLPTGATLEGGALNADLQVNGTTNRLVTTGNVGLYSAKIGNFDLGSKLAVVASLAGIKTGKDLDIEKLTSDVRVAPDGLQVQNFQTVVTSLGTLVGNGTIDARNELDFKMAATLTGGSAAGGSGAAPAARGSSASAAGEAQGGGIGALLGRITGEAAGGALGSAGGILRGCKGTAGPAIPFQIKGTTKDPKFIPDVGGIAAGILKSQLGCAGGAAPRTSQQQQQANPNNPADALRSLFKQKP